MSDERARPDLQALHTYFARASDCSHMDLRTIGELLEYAGRLEAENAALDGALERAHGYAAFLYSCAKCGEPPETYEWYLAKLKEVDEGN